MTTERVPHAASDLIPRAPKPKFLFHVIFSFSEQYQALNTGRIEYDFLVKTSTRPKVDYEWEEVNMYNFHTKVLKRSKFSSMSMSFHDDNNNHMMTFYKTYINSTIPITNMNGSGRELYEDGGLKNFNTMGKIEPSAFVSQNSSNTGRLFGSNTSLNREKLVLKDIFLVHRFAYGAGTNTYNFINPKITSLELDDLDMSSSEPTELKIEFDYDNIFLVLSDKTQAARLSSLLETSTNSNSSQPRSMGTPGGGATGRNAFGGAVPDANTRIPTGGGGPGDGGVEIAKKGLFDILKSTNVGDDILNGVQDVLNSAIASGGAVLNSSEFGAISGQLANIPDLADGLIGDFSNFINTFSTGSLGIGNALNGVINNSLGNLGAGFGDALSGGISGALGDVNSALNGALGNISGSLTSGLSSALSGSGLGGIGGGFGGIDGIINSIDQNVTSTVNGLLNDSIDNVFAATGVDSLVSTFNQSAVNVEGLIGNINNSLGSSLNDVINGSISNVVGGRLGEQLSGSFSTISNTPFNTIKTNVNTGLNKLNNKANDLIASASNTINNLL